MILGKTTRQEIVNMGGKLLDGKYGKYDMPDHTMCFFHDNSPFVNQIIIYNPYMSIKLQHPTEVFPSFYEDYIGLSWYKTDEEIINTLENLGFKRDSYQYAIRETIWCKKYEKPLRITISHAADTGELMMYIFDCKQD